MKNQETLFTSHKYRIYTFMSYINTPSTYGKNIYKLGAH